MRSKIFLLCILALALPLIIQADQDSDRRGGDRDGDCRESEHREHSARTPVHLAGIVAVQVFRIVLFGALGGCALGMLSARYLASLLYGVKAGQPSMLVMPLLAILAIAISATQPVVALALRIEPAEILRSE